MDQLQMTGHDTNAFCLEDLSFDTVILCDGDFPTHPIPLNVLHRASHLCCCDGAGRHCLEKGITPWAIVGDGDSLGSEFRLRHADLFHLVSEQDDNDQTKATRFCMKQGARSVAYLGSTGKREDHTLGNISLLVRYAREFHLRVVMLTDHGYFLPAQGRLSLKSFPRQQVSVFNVDCRQLSSQGLKWPITAFTSAWQGTLNEAEGHEVVIEGDGWFLVYATYEAKQA